eukprot:SAG31_NODE_1129_length_9755_cov_2.095070_3_plen_96_part_00
MHFNAPLRRIHHQLHQMLGNWLWNFVVRVSVQVDLQQPTLRLICQTYQRSETRRCCHRYDTYESVTPASPALVDKVCTDLVLIDIVIVAGERHIE